MNFGGLSYKVDGLTAQDEAIKIYAEATKMLIEEFRSKDIKKIII